MTRELLSDLIVLKAVAEEGSFTAAANRLESSQSQVSLVIRRIERAVGTSVVARTTRRLALTEAGERMLSILSPAAERLDLEIAALRARTESPSGTIRLAALEHAAETLLWPTLTKFAHRYPDIKVEVTLDYGFNDLISGRFDAGIQIGENIEQDMIAVKIGPDLQIAVVASPSYFSQKKAPTRPRDLVDHHCINLRLSSQQGLLAWEFGRGGKRTKVRVGGQLTFNSIAMLKQAAINGHGIAYLPLDTVADELAEGRLMQVLKVFCQPLNGYHLYYNSRHQRPHALRLLIDALRNERQSSDQIE